MARVYVEFGQLIQFGNDCRSISSMIDGIKSAFQGTVGALDWDVQYMSDINNTAKQLTRKMDNYVQSLRSYQSFLYETHDKYAKLEGGNNSSGLGGAAAAVMAWNDFNDGVTAQVGGNGTVSQSNSSWNWDKFGQDVLMGWAGNIPVIGEILYFTDVLQGKMFGLVTGGISTGLIGLTLAGFMGPTGLIAGVTIAVVMPLVGAIQINGKSIAEWTDQAWNTVTKNVGNAVTSAATAVVNTAKNIGKALVSW